MTLGADPRGNIGYVRLSLFSHAVLQELFAIEDGEGKIGPNPSIIEKAVNSFVDVKEPTSTHQRDLVFRTYEAKATLYEVLEAQPGGLKDAGEVSVTLKAILESKDPQSRRAPTTKAIDFFRQLAKQAVINTQYPHAEIPAGVMALAREPAQ